jgi:hypothetical protein
MAGQVMRAMDTRLDEKLAAMNAAKGDQKVEAMASVINELVSQRKEMRENFISNFIRRNGNESSDRLLLNVRAHS